MSPYRSRVSEDEAVYVLLDAAPSPVVAVDEAGVIDYLNELAVDALGYGRDELLGRVVEVLVPEGLRTVHRGNRRAFEAEVEAEAVTGSVRMDTHVQVRRKDDSLFPAEISLLPLRTSHGLWTVATIIDVTERERRAVRMRELSRAYRALAQVNESIVRAPDEMVLFQETCRIAVELGGYLGAWVGRRDAVDTVVTLASSGDLDDYVDRLAVSLAAPGPDCGGPTALTLLEGKAHFSTDLPEDAATWPSRELSAGFGVRSMGALPLRQGRHTSAVITMYSGQGDFFDQEVRGVLTGVAENLSYALDGFDAEQRLQQFARERIDLSARIVAAQEEERARIAADVHDDSVQTLAAARLRLGALLTRLLEVAPELAPDVIELERTVATVGEGLRDLLFDLEPADARRTLPELVREAAQHVFDNTSVTCTVTVDQAGPDPGGSLSGTVRGQALRIVKEALVNARKHAGAARVEVHLDYQQQGVEVTIVDDGVGFDPDAWTRVPGHRGLTTMQDRATVVGGWCRLERGEQGQTVRFWVPYDAAAQPVS